MSTTTYVVSGMSCQHCIDAVTESVGAISGVEHVEVDLGAGTVQVTALAEPALADIEAALDEAGFDLAWGPGPS